VKTAHATRASKRATIVQKARPAAEMASLRADEDVVRSSGEEGGNDRSHAEQEMVVNPAQDGARSVPAAGSTASMPEGRNGPGGEQPEHPDEEICD
jgi:hypothetical protein